MYEEWTQRKKKICHSYKFGPVIKPQPYHSTAKHEIYYNNR